MIVILIVYQEIIQSYIFENDQMMVCGSTAPINNGPWSKKGWKPLLYIQSLLSDGMNLSIQWKTYFQFIKQL